MAPAKKHQAKGPAPKPRVSNESETNANNRELRGHVGTPARAQAAPAPPMMTRRSLRRRSNEPGLENLTYTNVADLTDLADLTNYRRPLPPHRGTMLVIEALEIPSNLDAPARSAAAPVGTRRRANSGQENAPGPSTSGYSVVGETDELVPLKRRSAATQAEQEAAAPQKVKRANGAEEANKDAPPASAEPSNRFICAVCLDSLVDREPTSTRCGHIFCAECIRKALTVCPSCPTCKKRTTKRMLFRIYV